MKIFIWITGSLGTIALGAWGFTFNETSSLQRQVSENKSQSAVLQEAVGTIKEDIGEIKVSQQKILENLIKKP